MFLAQATLAPVGEVSEKMVLDRCHRGSDCDESSEQVEFQYAGKALLYISSSGKPLCNWPQSRGLWPTNGVCFLIRRSLL